MKKSYFYKDKPIFGIDIRTDSVRVMQSVRKDGHFSIKGYGISPVDPSALKDGIITKPEMVANTIKQLLQESIVGTINSKRVALSIPASRTFNRAIKLPLMPPDQLHDAVMLETEQYTPAAIDNLYVDFTTINKTASEIEVFAVAAPKQVVESYLEVAHLLNLEPILVETRVDSIKRLFSMTNYGGIPSVLIDFDIATVDISIVDNHVISSGTVSIGDNFNQLVANKLRANPASVLGGNTLSEPEITESTDKDPEENELQLLIKEIRRMIRYYEERYSKSRQIEQVVLFGKDEMLPSIVALMTDQLRLPVRSSDLWQFFKFDKGVKPIPMDLCNDFLAVAGLCVAPPEEAFL